MRVRIFLVLLLCIWQQVHGSKSTTKKGGSILKNFFKNCLIVLALNYGANEVVHSGKPQVADSNSIACKYSVPDQNARVMMNFVKCAKDQDFEKYMFDNSKNCPKIKELYKQAEKDGKCALNIPKIISNGALAKFRGEQLSLATNVEMLKEYLLLYPGKSGAVITKDVSKFLHKWTPNEDFDFFRFTNLLELTELAHPDSTLLTIWMALEDYKDVNGDNAKNMFELIKLAFPDDARSAVWMVFKDYKDVNAHNAKKLLELTKLAYPEDAGNAVRMALHYKDVNADNAKSVLELATLAYPYDAKMAVRIALEDYKDVNAENAKKLFELTRLAYPDDAGRAVRMALNYKDVNADNTKKLFELTKLAYHDNTRKAVSMALNYKDVNADKVKKLLELTKIAFPDDTKKAVRMAASMALPYKDVNADRVKRVLKLTKILIPLDPRAAMIEALDPKYKDVDVDKVNKGYQDLKNSRSWYRTDEGDMKQALGHFYPEVVKEDF